MQLEFYKIWADVPDPTAATDSLSGQIPARALQFCEPFLAANRVGFLLYPPLDFNLMWDGIEVYVQLPDFTEDQWIKLDRIFLPDYVDYWRGISPESVHDASPAFLEAFPERGIVQVSLFFIVKTPSNVSTWIRGLINQNFHTAVTVLDGIVETDWWTGPLFTNLQLIKTDHPVQFRKTDPYVQIFPYAKGFHQPKQKNKTSRVNGSSEIPESIWTSFRENSVRRNSDRPGSYKRYAWKVNREPTK